MTWRALVALGLIGTGCKSDPPVYALEGGPSPVTSAAIAPKPADAGASAEIVAAESADAGAPLRCASIDVPDVLSLLGCRSEEEGLMNRPAGFSADGRYLGACTSACDSCPLHCRFTARAGPALDFTQWDARRDSRADALARSALSADEIERKIAQLEAVGIATFDRTLKALGLGPGAVGRGLSAPFPYPELVFVQNSTHDSADDKGTLLFGARAGSEEPVYPIRIEVGPHPLRKSEPQVDPTLKGAERASAVQAARLELREQFSMEKPLVLYVDVSKSGDELGVIAMAKGTFWHEEAHAARMDVQEFVGRVYNDTGMRVLARGDAPGAAGWFEKAEAARPGASLFSYNLACAYARAGNAGAEAALARAIQSGGAAIKKRAAADADFASVRAAAWFRALTKP